MDDALDACLQPSAPRFPGSVNDVLRTYPQPSAPERANVLDDELRSYLLPSAPESARLLQAGVTSLRHLFQKVRAACSRWREPITIAGATLVPRGVLINWLRMNVSPTARLRLTEGVEGGVLVEGGVPPKQWIGYVESDHRAICLSHSTQTQFLSAAPPHAFPPPLSSLPPPLPPLLPPPLPPLQPPPLPLPSLALPTPAPTPPPPTLMPTTTALPPPPARLSDLQHPPMQSQTLPPPHPHPHALLPPPSVLREVLPLPLPTPPARPLVILRCIGAKEPIGCVLPLPTTGVFEIGRLGTCDHAIDDVAVSASHCKLHIKLSDDAKADADVAPVKLWLEDCSTNGTFLGAERLAKGGVVRLRHGDSFGLLQPHRLDSQYDRPPPYLYKLAISMCTATEDPSEVLLRLKASGQLAMPRGGAARVGIDGCWRCDACKNVNFPTRAHCNQCRAKRNARATDIVQAHTDALMCCSSNPPRRVDQHGAEDLMMTASTASDCTTAPATGLPYSVLEAQSQVNPTAAVATTRTASGHSQIELTRKNTSASASALVLCATDARDTHKSTARRASVVDGIARPTKEWEVKPYRPQRPRSLPPSMTGERQVVLPAGADPLDQVRPSARYTKQSWTIHQYNGLNEKMRGPVAPRRNVGHITVLAACMQATVAVDSLSSSPLKSVEWPVTESSDHEVGKGNLVLRLNGPETVLRSFLRCIESCASVVGKAYVDEAAKFGREQLWPIFVMTRGRPETAHLNWSAEHALGNRDSTDASEDHVIAVVSPEEETEYRRCWPSALLLILPEGGRSVGYARSIVKRALEWRVRSRAFRVAPRMLPACRVRHGI